MLTRLSFEALKCNLFQPEYIKLSQRRMKDLEKSNTFMRKENDELNAVLKAAEKKAKKVENMAESS